MIEIILEKERMLVCWVESWQEMKDMCKNHLHGAFSHRTQPFSSLQQQRAMAMTGIILDGLPHLALGRILSIGLDPLD